MNRKHLLITLSLVCLCSCSTISTSSKESSESATSASESSVSLTSSDSSSEFLADSSYDFSSLSLNDFFDYEERPAIVITASPEALSFMSEYQSSKTSQYSDCYIPADLKITFKGNVYVFREVGIRMKGNMSRHEFYDGRFQGLTHFKVSLKATFDDSCYKDRRLSSFKHDWSNDAAGRKQRKNRNFIGLEKFDLKFIPRNESSAIREIYCYDRFRENGFMAPYSNVVDFTLSDGKNSKNGTYQIIETIDKEFLKRRLSKDEAKGDLYKCTYNSMGKADFTRGGAVDYSDYSRVARGKIGVKDAWEGYFPTYDLKTNDDNGENSDFSAMTNLIHVLWSTVYDYGSKDDLKRVLDVDEFLRFSAAAYLMGNFDDQRYNYNNFYLYFRPGDKKAMMIPYDWDWSLGEDMGIGLAYAGPLDGWTLGEGTNSNIYQATLFGVSTTAIDQSGYRQAYLDYVDELADSILDIDVFYEIATKIGITDEISSVYSYMETKRWQL